MGDVADRVVGDHIQRGGVDHHHLARPHRRVWPVGTLRTRRRAAPRGSAAEGVLARQQHLNVAGDGLGRRNPHRPRPVLVIQPILQPPAEPVQATGGVLSFTDPVLSEDRIQHSLIGAGQRIAYLSAASVDQPRTFLRTETAQLAPDRPLADTEFSGLGPDPITAPRM
ncbi:hypothetical protein AB0G15_33955 [Streptosporangium sp. NPDC023825]|uniref:hypothetical protein n=1 Tax=Streptosporangium sp. NPDC023825 TaxID=3154909 RepID=UPI00341BF5A0